MTWYTGNTTYDTTLLIGFVVVAVIGLSAIFNDSPYGRFGGKSAGIRLSPRVGWMLMELPAPLFFAYFFLQGDNRHQLVPTILFTIWMLHYANRGFINPMLMRVHPGTKASFNISVVLFGWVVTSLHGYYNGTFIAQLGSHFTDDWLTDPRFLVGLTIYLAGFTLNVHSDAVLRNLRPKVNDPSAPRYKIPHGGGYRYVSSPSYLGEMLSWLGFAIFTWSLAGVFILAVTVANLLPRALATHKWYQQRFEQYPKERKALIPFVL